MERICAHLEIAIEHPIEEYKLGDFAHTKCVECGKNRQARIVIRRIGEKRKWKKLENTRFQRQLEPRELI